MRMLEAQGYHRKCGAKPWATTRRSGASAGAPTGSARMRHGGRNKASATDGMRAIARGTAHDRRTPSNRSVRACRCRPAPRDRSPPRRARLDTRSLERSPPGLLGAAHSPRSSQQVRAHALEARHLVWAELVWAELGRRARQDAVGRWEEAEAFGAGLAGGAVGVGRASEEGAVEVCRAGADGGAGRARVGMCRRRRRVSSRSPRPRAGRRPSSSLVPRPASPRAASPCPGRGRAGMPGCRETRESASIRPFRCRRCSRRRLRRP